MDNGHPLATNTTLRTTVVVRNPHGLHMRPAMAFAKLAAGYKSAVNIRKQDRTVNGKSGLYLMMLAVECGTELELELTGEDAAAALPVLAAALGAESADAM